jgi:hypothetical protein
VPPANRAIAFGGAFILDLPASDKPWDIPPTNFWGIPEQMAANDAMHAFLQSVLDAVNAQVPHKIQLAYDRRDARQIARRGKGLTELEREILQDEPDARASWAHQRRSDLLTLATTSKDLSPDEWTEVTRDFNNGLPRMTGRMVGDRSVVDEIPTFESKDAEITLRAKIAFALINLAAPEDSVFEIRQCLKKGCGNLLLVRRGLPGAPRKCCSDRHTAAYNQQQSRERKKTAQLKRAAKHK